MLVKCQFCGKKIDKKNAYCISKDYQNKNGEWKVRNHFYCSESEYCEANKSKRLRVKIIELCQELIDQHFNDTMLSKMVSELSKEYDIELVFNYLYENRDYIYRLLASKNFVSVFAELKYLKAVIQNNIQKYKETLTENSVHVDVEYLDDIDIKAKYKPSKKRKGFAAIEAEVEEVSYI